MWPALLLDVVIALALLALLNSFAPMQWLSAFFYAGLVLVHVGVISLLWPLRFLGVHTRRIAGVVLIAGVAVGVAALLWPVTEPDRPAGATLLDREMPAYDFWEYHECDVAAPAARVRQAIDDVTFEEIRGFRTLMQIRSGFRAVNAPTGLRVLKTMTTEGGGFIPLAETPQETLIGMGAKPWGGGGRFAHTVEDYKTYREPGAVKVAFNLQVIDLGGGHSRVTTETRVQGVDAEGTRTMARYWRVIYPGSALIRKMWLYAIRDRAERVG